MPNVARRAARRVRAWRGEFTLEPLANVTRHGPVHFNAESNDPQLRLRAKHGLPIGWVRLELAVSSAPAYHFSPQLFFDTGKGWREADSVRLPAPTAGKLTAFMRVPGRVRDIRLDVGEARGAFQVTSLRMWEVSGAEAWLEHLGRLGLGLQSWHPSHAWERRRELLASFTHRARNMLGGSPAGAGLSPLLDLPATPSREARLALYASENNEARAQAAQKPRPLRVPQTQPGVSVIILNLNKPELIVPQLDRLEREREAFEKEGLRLQVLVGDTGSTDAKVLARYEKLGRDVRVERGLNYHFSRCNNAVAQKAECDTLLFLNNDVIFPDGRNPVLEMYRQLQAQPERGVVGCCLLYGDGLVQHVGVDFLRDPPVRGLCFHPRVRTKLDMNTLKPAWRVPAVTGACLMIRHALFLEVGGMDEGYAAECQDIALCLATHRLGYETQIVNAGHVLHLENATRPKGEENWPDRQRFLRRWGSYIEVSFL